jgi:hypothetical protein
VTVSTRSENNHQGKKGKELCTRSIFNSDSRSRPHLWMLLKAPKRGNKVGARNSSFPAPTKADPIAYILEQVHPCWDTYHTSSLLSRHYCTQYVLVVSMKRNKRINASHAAIMTLTSCRNVRCHVVPRGQRQKLDERTPHVQLSSTLHYSSHMCLSFTIIHFVAVCKTQQEWMVLLLFL